jgi:hypothetical protein
LVDVVAWVVAVAVLLAPTIFIVAFIAGDKGGVNAPQAKPVDADCSDENYWRGYY